MVIAPCNSVHMFFMRFPIDIVFVAKDGTVVKACPNVRPWRIALAWRAFAVIEGPVGLIERTGTQQGDGFASLRVGPGTGDGARLLRAAEPRRDPQGRVRAVPAVACHYGDGSPV